MHTERDLERLIEQKQYKRGTFDKYPITKRIFARTVLANNTLFAGTILMLTPLKFA